MLGMRNCKWTVCLAIIWLFMGVAMILMHASLAKVNPAIKDFPQNLNAGFMDGFGFSKLKTLSADVMNASRAALNLCGVDCNSKVTCTGLASNPVASLGNPPYTVVDTSASKSNISTAFTKGLTQMQRVGTDKYFGQPSMEEVSNETIQITARLTVITNPSSCLQQVPLYATMWNSGDTLYDSYTQVKAEIDKMTGGEIVEKFNDYGEYLKYLHAIPWILFISTFFFMIMWWMNGACCCCPNGGILQTCCLAMPQYVLWILAFVVNIIFAAAGWLWTYFLMEQKATMFKGEPEVGDLLGHTKSVFPVFWNTCKFTDLEDGLKFFRLAATIFVLVSLMIACYSCLFCCARPYGIGKGRKVDDESRYLKENP